MLYRWGKCWFDKTSLTNYSLDVMVHENSIKLPNPQKSGFTFWLICILCGPPAAPEKGHFLLTKSLFEVGVLIWSL